MIAGPPVGEPVRQLQIGDTVWLFDANRRIYDKTQSSGPIFREHFRPVQIVGETRTSWIVEWDERRVNKRTLQTKAEYGIGQRVYVSPAEIEDAVFAHDYSYKIAERVKRCESADALRQIDALLAALERNP